MSSFNIIYKHSRGCLHSVVLECPFDDISPAEQERFVESLFSKANPKSKVIAILPLFRDDLVEGEAYEV